MFYFRLNRILCWQYFALNLLLMQRKHRDAKTSFIFINICLIYCGVSKTNLFTLYCCQCHITYSISVGFPMNLSFYDVLDREVNDALEFYREISCYDYILNYCKTKDLQWKRINRFHQLWSTLYWKNGCTRVCIYKLEFHLLYRNITYCTYENHFHLVLNCV